MEICYVCPQCGKRYPVTADRWKCDCGGCLTMEYDKHPLDFEKLARDPERSLWRYIDAMPFHRQEDCWRRATMGEGGTPLLRVDYDDPRVLIKGEYYAPTLSFKDRGAVTVMALARRLGVTHAAADSSGNAGTAIAAYGARLGIACDVFVPASTSDKKIAQITAHGARIHKIPGSREDTAAAAIDAVEQGGAFYASHIFNPFFHEGTKTYIYEIYEQMGGKLPDVLIVPVGNGTLLLGACLALSELRDWGYIDHLPHLVAVQARNCSPLAQAFAEGQLSVSPVPTQETAAEGIAIAAPARGSQILELVRAIGGSFITVEEGEIVAARQEMAKFGIYVEVTSAANYAALLRYRASHPESAEQTIVLPACGAGIKSK